MKKLRTIIPAMMVLMVACTSNSQKGSPSVEKPKSAPASETARIESQGDMVFFEGGTFMMGSAAGTPQEQPVHEVTVKSFRMDKHPVTVRDFRRFARETNYRTDADKFGDSGVFDFNTSGWKLVPGANWEYPQGKTLP